MRVSWLVKCQLIGGFSLVFDIHWIHCQYLQQIEIYLDHQYIESVSKKNLVLLYRQNICPVTTLIFLVFSCWVIWRVTTCSPLALRQYFINTAQNLLSLLSKIPAHNVAYRHFISPSHLKVLLSTNLFQSLQNASSKSSKFLIPAVWGKMLQVAFSFQNSARVTYARHFFNFKRVLQIFI